MQYHPSIRYADVGLENGTMIPFSDLPSDYDPRERGWTEVQKMLQKGAVVEKEGRFSPLREFLLSPWGTSLIITVIVVLVFRRMLILPILFMTKFIQELAEWNLKKSFEYKSSDELEALSFDLSEMRLRLVKFVTNIRDVVESVVAILDSQEMLGLINNQSLDLEGKVSLSTSVLDNINSSVNDLQSVAAEQNNNVTYTQDGV